MQSSELLNKITKAKRSQAQLTRYLIAQDPRLGLKVRYCGSWLHFREWMNEGETRLMNANFCKRHLVCQACAVRRAGKMQAAYLPKIEKAMKDNPHAVPAMVTLTVRNGSDLAERVAHLKAAWKAMLAARRKGASLSGKHAAIEWNKVLGSLKAMEVTLGKGGWHVHFHIFVLLSDYIDPRKLSAEWLRFSKDSFIVDVRKCRNGIRAGLVEVLKYSTKFSSMSHADIYHVHQVAQGSRLIDGQGILRGVKVGDLDEDDISDMEGPYRDFLALWFGVGERYTLVDLPEVPPPPILRQKAAQAAYGLNCEDSHGSDARPPGCAKDERAGRSGGRPENPKRYGLKTPPGRRKSPLIPDSPAPETGTSPPAPPQ